MMKIIGIHQPETFPYPGFFSKMLCSNEFIILDNVQYKKNNYQNRNRILNQTPQWMSIPILLEGRMSSTIAVTKIANNIDWKSRMITQLANAYKKCPFYEMRMEPIINIITQATDNLYDFNMAIILYMKECLLIETPIISSSTLDVHGHKSDLVLNICKQRNADVYLSGKGGRDYLEIDKFKAEKIDVLYQVYDETISYPQLSNSGFVPYMSTIDLLMNADDMDARKYIEDVCHYIS